jgi:tetratricopeptide (TPR) repeat protein
MKCLYTVLIIILSINTYGQVKGVTPISKSSVTHEQTYAVVIGISDYQDKDIPDLQYADKDALAFAGFLQSPAGGSLDEDHLKVLINEEATVAQFATALDWLWEVVKENDKVIIYFSGHGDVERKSLTQPGFLLCWDAPARVYMAGGTFALPMLQEVISTLSIQNKAKVIVITDACRSGKLSGSAVNGANITGANLAKQYANEIKILSCQPEEYSIEGLQWGGGRGAFSYHLLDGLSGLADDNTDGHVSLKEIGRYLEDRVTEEVAPLSQNPMIIGNKTENLADISPDFLAQVKERKKGEKQFFASTESRGIEENVLESADSSVVEMYNSFKKSLKEKKFFSPKNACAESYYQNLVAETSLDKLHSSMRRNYAAALQDDAQQVMNNWLKSDLNELALSKVSKSAKYKAYPQYLNRAAELLGENHYMYSTLIARKLYFEGYLMHIDLNNPDKELGEIILAKYRKSLQLLPNSPHTFKSMSEVHFYQMDDVDSSEYYAHLAVEFAPTWLRSYSTMGFMYLQSPLTKDTARARYFLEKADDIDSTARLSNITHINNWGNYYNRTKQYDEAAKTFQKSLEIDSVYGKTWLNLGLIYINQKKYAQGANCFLKVIKIDSSMNLAHSNLGVAYIHMNRLEEAEESFLKARSMDSLNVSTINGLFLVYVRSGRFKEAEVLIKKSIALDPTISALYNNLGSIYMQTYRFKEAEKQFLKCIEMDSTFFMSYAGLGSLYQMKSEWEKAISMFQKAIDNNPTNAKLYCQIASVYANLPDDGKLKAKDALDKALELEPSNPEIYVFQARLCVVREQYDDALDYLSQGLDLGVGKGSFTHYKLKINPKFKELRKDQKWEELMKKHFPDKYKE